MLRYADRFHHYLNGGAPAQPNTLYTATKTYPIPYNATWNRYICIGGFKFEHYNQIFFDLNLTSYDEATFTFEFYNFAETIFEQIYIYVMLV